MFARFNATTLGTWTYEQGARRKESAKLHRRPCSPNPESDSRFTTQPALCCTLTVLKLAWWKTLMLQSRP